MKKFLLILIAFGLHAATFDMVNFDPRVLAMGGVSVFNVYSGGGIITNPANAGYFKGKEFTAMFGKLSDFPVYNGLINYDVEDNGVAAGGLYWQYSGYRLYDNEYNWSENMIGYAIGKKFSWHLSLGMGIKILSVGSNFEKGKAFGGSVDVGATGDVLGSFFWGVSLKNLYSRLKWDTGRKEKLPMELNLGFGFLNIWDRFSAGLELKSKNGIESVGFGMEFWVVKGWFALRGGAIQKIVEPSRTIPTAGFTVSVPSGKNVISINYGASFDQQVVGFIHRLSLNIYRY